MFRFSHIEVLYLLLLIPAIIIIYLVYGKWRKKALSAYAEIELHNVVFPDLSLFKNNLKFVLYIIAFTIAIIGIADPQFGTKLEDAKRKGIDLMIALDVSNSMKAQDLNPDRLTLAKQALSKLVDKLQGDRIGIVIFGGEAYTQLPITTDYAAAKLFLQNIDCDLIPTQGTAIGLALETSMQSFSKESKNKKAIIVITDGENHEDDALKIAEVASAEGIIIHTVGMGSENGAPIPAGNGNFKKDNLGNTVVTKLNEEMLKQLAIAGKGTYVRASNSNVGLSIILDEINKLEKNEYGSKSFTDYENRYQWLLLPAILILLVELFISEKKDNVLNNLLNKLN